MFQQQYYGKPEAGALMEDGQQAVGHAGHGKGSVETSPPSSVPTTPIQQMDAPSQVRTLAATPLLILTVCPVRSRLHYLTTSQ